MLKMAFCFQPVKCFTGLEIRPCGWVKSWWRSWKIKKILRLMWFIYGNFSFFF